jgi:hypothetical protein
LTTAGETFSTTATSGVRRSAGPADPALAKHKLRRERVKTTRRESRFMKMPLG